MDAATTGRHRHAGRDGLSRLVVPLAFALVALPYLVAILRVLATSGATVVLPDDLALIDLHTRRALGLHQQLGVFDHNGWSHPGPAYFYWQSLAYRAFGSRPGTLFLGAALLSALSALGALWAIRRRSSPMRTLAAAGLVAWLGFLLAAHAPEALTYSEGPLGGLVSPWNPMVVILPLLLLAVLVAAAVDGSGPSAVAAGVVASFVLQANISSGPLALSMLVVGVVGWALAAWRRRRRAEPSWRPWALGGAAGALLVLMWVPPLLEQLSGRPGNMTLIWRFFTGDHPGQPLSAGLWTLVDVGATAVVGPSQVMGSLLGDQPPKAALGILVLLVSLGCSATAVVLGIGQRRRFAVGLGILGLLGTAVLLASFLRVVGFIYGYLSIWAVVVPLVGILSVAMLSTPSALRGEPARRIAIGLLLLGSVAASLGFALRAATTPPVTAASDPQVAAMAAMVASRLSPGELIEVDDAGAGTKDTQLLDTERFIGLVNELDRRGYSPRVISFWQAQFGDGYLVDGSERRKVVLETWTSSSGDRSGYVGRAGDIAVFISARR